MPPLRNKYLRFCSKTGKFVGFKPLRGPNRLLFPLIGLAALLWIIIRVAQKPSRATYPCVRAAAPVAASFLVYVAGLLSSVLLFRKAKRQIAASRVLRGLGTLLLVVAFGISPFLQTDHGARAEYQSALEGANQPIGTGKGIFPGRVVWVHNAYAVDQSCANTTGDYWWQDDNTRQSAVDSMVSQAIQLLTGKGSDATAWDALFRSYNQSHGKGDVGYTAGEKIVIKINLNTGASGSTYVRSDYRTVDTSPQIVCSVLDQLVRIVGVAQADIGFGDPGRNVDNIFWDKFHQTFPNVKYWGNGNGRTPIVQSATPQMRTSDGSLQNYLPTCYLDAAYMINIPVFKQHHRAGISLTCKNHFGTFVPFLGNAFPLHYSLPCTNGDRNVDNGGYGKYRIFVDLMGHRDLGGKTILYLIDGLWSSTNWGDPPWKWRMAPFNTKYPASVFASQDPVAIESVGFDFLYNEFYVGNPSGNDFPRYSGVDDFLHQAADSVNWAPGIRYDPENDGTALPRSMGVHEHWNNATDKQYSRNLQTGEGIELVVEELTTDVDHDIQSGRLPGSVSLGQNYPNPFNPTTVVSFQLSAVSNVRLGVYDLQGREVAVLVNERKDPGTYSLHFDGARLSSGVYLLRLTAGGFSQTRKMVVEK
jgi:hypothetical protein